MQGSKSAVAIREWQEKKKRSCIPESFYSKEGALAVKNSLTRCWGSIPTVGAAAIRIYGLWPAHLFLSCMPGLIITQSCLTSYEAASVCLPAWRLGRGGGGGEEGKRTVRRSGKCEREVRRHRGRSRGYRGDRRARARHGWTREGRGNEEKRLREGKVKERVTEGKMFLFYSSPPPYFPSNLHSYLAALAGTTGVFPLGRLVACQPVYLRICLSQYRFSAVHLIPPPARLKPIRQLAWRESGLLEGLSCYNKCPLHVK